MKKYLETFQIQKRTYFVLWNNEVVQKIAYLLVSINREMADWLAIYRYFFPGRIFFRIFKIHDFL